MLENNSKAEEKQQSWRTVEKRKNNIKAGEQQ